MLEVSRYIVDASVATKWHLKDEDHVEQSLQLLQDFTDGKIDLLAPDHIHYEVPSAIRNAISTGRFRPQQARAEIADFLLWGIPTIHSETLIRAAFEQAVTFGCSLYDGLYVALAEAVQCPLVLADGRLRNALERRFEYYLWIEDY